MTMYEPDEYYDDLLIENVMHEWDFDEGKARAIIEVVMGVRELSPDQKQVFLSFAESLIEEEYDPDADEEGEG